jgi:hypothetical protein
MMMDNNKELIGIDPPCPVKNRDCIHSDKNAVCIVPTVPYEQHFPF